MTDACDLSFAEECIKHGTHVKHDVIKNSKKATAISFYNSEIYISCMFLITENALSVFFATFDSSKLALSCVL